MKLNSERLYREINIILANNPFLSLSLFLSFFVFLSNERTGFFSLVNASYEKKQKIRPTERQSYNRLEGKKKNKKKKKNGVSNVILAHLPSSSLASYNISPSNHPRQVSRGNQYDAMYRFVSFVMIINICATLLAVECKVSKKIYMRPLRFKYVDNDQETSASHHEEKPHHDDESHAESGKMGHHVEDHETKGHKGHESYKSYHESDEGEKQHLNETGHKNHYDAEKEHDGEKHEDEDRYKERHKGEKAEKSGEFEEEAKHQKGHSTKGEHNIFKKNEYEKKRNFYDEFHEDDEQERHGARHKHRGGSKGGHRDSESDKSAKHREKEENENKYNNGHHRRNHEKDDIHNGHTHRKEYREKIGNKGLHGDGKKWSHKH